MSRVFPDSREWVMSPIAFTFVLHTLHSLHPDDRVTLAPRDDTVVREVERVMMRASSLLVLVGCVAACDVLTDPDDVAMAESSGDDASSPEGDDEAEGAASSGAAEDDESSATPAEDTSGASASAGEGHDTSGAEGSTSSGWGSSSGDATGTGSTGSTGSDDTTGTTGSTGGESTSGSESSTTGSGSSGGSESSGSTGGDPPVFDDGPPAGNPDGHCEIPADAGLENVSNPTTVVGDGTPASCTGDAFIEAVAGGGVITFDCGPEPVVIELDRPAKVFNDTGPEIVIDGGGLVTLSGGGTTRILYMNTCDQAQRWTTDHCQDQDHPRLTVQNLTFVNGNSKSEGEYDGGGAIWARGGRLKVVNSRFFNNECADTGPDVGGAAVRALSQYNGLPVYVVNSTFGGDEGYGNVCSNGGGISSIGVSWSIYNSLFSHNRAIGNGGNPAASGTPGGGSGGAIYNDGRTMTLSLCGTAIHDNEVNTHGSAIFFVSNDHTGDIEIEDSVITNNVGGSWYPAYPQLSHHSDTPVRVTNSVIE